MPVMDGLAATRLIRADGRFAALPILAMTASVLQSDRDRCTEAGMNDHVAKPIEPDELARKLGQWLAGRVDGAAATPAARAALPADAVAVPLPAAAAAGAVPEMAPGAPTSVPPELAALADVPGLDVADGLRRMLGKTDRYLGLLRQFVTTQAEAPAALAAALTAADRTLGRRLAHTLRGVAGTIGAGPVRAAAGQLEDLLADSGIALEAPAVAQALAAVRQSVNDLVHALSAVLPPDPLAVAASAAQAGAAPDRAGQGGGLAAEQRDAVEALCNQLTLLLAESDPGALRLLEADGALLASALGPAVATLVQQVRAFDFDAALDTLNDARAAVG